MSVAHISGKSLLQYGFIAVPVAFAGFPLYILAPDFYATQYGLSLTLLGTLLLVIRLFDAIQDPIIGWVTDRYQPRLFQLLACGGIVLCAAIYGLFNLIFFSPAIWFALCVILAVTAYSVLTIVLGVQATLWTNEPNEQTRIAGAREAFGLVGLVIAVSAPVLLTHAGDADDTYLWYSLILVGLMSIGVINFSKVVRPAQSLSKNSSRQLTASPFSVWRALPAESIKLLSVYAISMLASSIPSVLVIFYVRDFLGAELLTGLFLLLYFLSGAAAIPLWKKLSVRFGKYKVWCLANVLAVTGFIGAAFLSQGDIGFFAAVCFLSGLAFGADLTLPPSILAGHIHAHNNLPHAASHYALLAFILKASLAFASAMVLPILDWVGFQPTAKNSSLALTTLSLSYSVLPCLLKIIAAGLLYKFFIQYSAGGKNENLQSCTARDDLHDAQ